MVTQTMKRTLGRASTLYAEQLTDALDAIDSVLKTEPVASSSKKNVDTESAPTPQATMDVIKQTSTGRQNLENAALDLANAIETLVDVLPKNDTTPHQDPTKLATEIPQAKMGEVKLPSSQRQNLEPAANKVAVQIEELVDVVAQINTDPPAAQTMTATEIPQAKMGNITQPGQHNIGKAAGDLADAIKNLTEVVANIDTVPPAAPTMTATEIPQAKMGDITQPPKYAIDLQKAGDALINSINNVVNSISIPKTFTTTIKDAPNKAADNLRQMLGKLTEIKNKTYTAGKARVVDPSVTKPTGPKTSADNFRDNHPVSQSTTNNSSIPATEIINESSPQGIPTFLFYELHEQVAEGEKGAKLGSYNNLMVLLPSVAEKNVIENYRTGPATSKTDLHTKRMINSRYPDTSVTGDLPKENPLKSSLMQSTQPYMLEGISKFIEERQNKGIDNSTPLEITAVDYNTGVQAAAAAKLLGCTNVQPSFEFRFQHLVTKSDFKKFDKAVNKEMKSIQKNQSSMLQDMKEKLGSTEYIWDEGREQQLQEELSKNDQLSDARLDDGAGSEDFIWDEDREQQLQDILSKSNNQAADTQTNNAKKDDSEQHDADSEQDADNQHSSGPSGP